MKKLILLGMVVAVIGFVFPIAGAGLVPMKELNRNTLNYKGQEIMVSGRVIVVERVKFGLYVTNLNKPQPETKQREAEINLYLLNDDSDEAYLLSLRYFDDRQRINTKARVIATSRESLTNDSVILFDRYISQKNGLSSLGYSRFTLQNTIKKLPRGKLWTLLIDVE